MKLIESQGDLIYLFRKSLSIMGKMRNAQKASEETGFKEDRDKKKHFEMQADSFLDAIGGEHPKIEITKP